MGLHDKVTVEITRWDLMFLVHATTLWLNQQHALNKRHSQNAVAMLEQDSYVEAKKAKRKVSEVETRIKHTQRINARLINICQRALSE